MFRSFQRHFLQNLCISYAARRQPQCTVQYYHENVEKPLLLEKISTRSTLKVKGPHAKTFLQGLITNDMDHLKHSSSSMYTMFLNSKGRVLADSIIYRVPEENTYLIEIDSSITTMLEKHLTSYILRKKIEVFNLETILSLWVLFDPESPERHPKIHSKINEILHSHKNPNKLICSHALYRDILFIYKDPRSLQLGIRILTSTDIGAETIRDKFNIWNDREKSSHKLLRYRLGVSEGILELPPRKCFPLEANCDYLHGISFQKGCYLGQELTARVYHTGVIRKRLMPLIFKSIVDKGITSGETPILLSHDKSIVGKLRGVQGKYGLGLLRIDNALKYNDFTVGELKAVTMKPSWWPIEAPKEIVKIEAVEIKNEQNLPTEDAKKTDDRDSELLLESKTNVLTDNPKKDVISKKS